MFVSVSHTLTLPLALTFTGISNNTPLIGPETVMLTTGDATVTVPEAIDWLLPVFLLLLLALKQPDSALSYTDAVMTVSLAWMEL